MVDLQDRTTGNTIVASDHNLIKDYIEDGVHEVNTLSLEIGGTEVISSGRILNNVTIDASDIADGSVTDTEFQYINSVTSNVQTQLNAKGTMSNVVEDTTPQLGGNLDWNSNGMMLVGQTVGGSAGDLVYLSGANTWTQADASAEATCKGMLGINISANTVLTHGLYTTSGLTAGSVYYSSETAGAITTTAPTTSTAIVRIIGYALSTTELFVDPDKTYVEVA